MVGKSYLWSLLFLFLNAEYQHCKSGDRCK